MSLLEDVFLQDEAAEAQELERVIEGDEYDDVPRAVSPTSDNNSEKEDEAEEDKRRVDPTKVKEKKIVRHPRFILNPARLTGPRGIHVLPEHFKDFKFKGKGHEKEDLDLVLKKLEHWAYRLYPKFQFEDCLKKIETLGKKRPVMVHLHKIRTDQFQSEETVVQQDSSDDEAVPTAVQEEDEFDRLLQQQIELARATPAPGSVRKGFQTPGLERTPAMPKATSSPSINEEQKERMLRNRKLAEEKRLARLKQNSTNNDSIDKQTDKEIESIDVTEEIIPRKNRSNIIDSSDDDDDRINVVESITVDIHDSTKTDETIKLNKADIQMISSEDTELEIRNEDDNVFDDLRKETNGDIVLNLDDEIGQEQSIGNDREITPNVIVDTNAVVSNINETVNKENDSNISKVSSEIASNDIEKGTDVNETSIFVKSIEISTETDSKDKLGKGGVHIHDEISDIMDVDFSDDF